MGKDEQVRINQTVAHIVAQCPQPERATVQAYLDRWIAANFAQADTKSAFSATLSTHGVAGRGDEPTRAGGRSLMILRTSAMLN
ncbi:MAG: hypothetical protein ACP5NI_10960 [Acetobacteraceae bacterium]